MFRSLRLRSALFPLLGGVLGLFALRLPTVSLRLRILALAVETAVGSLSSFARLCGFGLWLSIDHQKFASDQSFDRTKFVTFFV